MKRKVLTLILFLICTSICFEILNMIIYSTFGFTTDTGGAVMMSGGVAGYFIFNSDVDSSKS